MIDAFSDARDDSDIGVIILTGAGDKAFCSGGDQHVRGHGGYVGKDQIPRLNVLDLQRLIRTFQNPSSRWSKDMRSAADTSCMSFVI